MEQRLCEIERVQSRAISPRDGSGGKSTTKKLEKGETERKEVWIDADKAQHGRGVDIVKAEQDQAISKGWVIVGIGISRRKPSLFDGMG